MNNMGFSPGDFKTANEILHFEQKDGGRIILWNDDESIVLFEVDVANARLMISHLQTCIFCITGEPE